MRYRVHRFDIDMTKDQRKLEQFLNNLEGEVAAIIPSVNPKFTVRGAGATVDFLLIVEKNDARALNLTPHTLKVEKRVEER
jgi:hypothetical protein